MSKIFGNVSKKQTVIERDDTGLPSVDRAVQPDHTVYERDGKWWWHDEAWHEYGPCSSEESARRRQGMYVRFVLEEPRSGDPVPVSASEWLDKKMAESENTVHPCTHSSVWECDCAGACSCHWQRERPSEEET